MKFYNNEAALKFLEERNINPDNTFIFTEPWGRLTQDIKDAINYLCAEWDYGFIDNSATIE